MKRFKLLLLAASLFIITGCGSRALNVEWTGSTDLSMIEKVKADIKHAQDYHYKMLRVEFISPGGPVITTLEITRRIREARDKGLLIEIHGRSLIASGAVLVLASASPGLRYIDKNSLTLIHGLQLSNWFESKCVDYTLNPKTEDDKVYNRLMEMVATDLATSTGYKVEDVLTWLKCGLEAAGGGELLINFKLADNLE